LKAGGRSINKFHERTKSLDGVVWFGWMASSRNGEVENDVALYVLLSGPGRPKMFRNAS